MARFFFALSRILFALMLVLAVLSPASAQENEPETTCVDQEDEDNTACTVHVNDYDDPPIVYMTVEEDQTAVEIITYTSLTCDDHETGEGTDTYAVLSSSSWSTHVVSGSLSCADTGLIIAMTNMEANKMRDRTKKKRAISPQYN